VTTLKRDIGPEAEGPGQGQAGTAGATPRAKHGWRAAAEDLPGLIRRHWIFSIALGLAVLPRLVAMLGFRPAVLFRLDTYDYLWGAVHLSPNVVNPSGYSLVLWLLRPFHSLVLVAALQHVAGLGVATMVYALLRRYGLPDWGATLAAAPVLFDPAQILVEQLIMADLLAMALMVGALTLLLIRRPPGLRQVVVAGLMMGTSVTVRPTTLPLVLLVPLFLLFTKAGWRRAGASLLAGILPVIGYVGWFAAAHGSVNLTNSNGLFLWSRTMSFANCAVIRPPADLRALCPNEQPGALAQPDPAKRLQPKRYLWNHGTWQWPGQHSGLVPDTAAFTPANNSRALRFAVDAITAQPFAYLRVVAGETVRPFIQTNDLRFPAYQPHSALGLNKAEHRYGIAAVRAYTGSDQGVAGDLGYAYGTQLHPPYASLMNEYQHAVSLPGPVFALIVLAGLGGIVLPRRRSAVAALLWVSAITIMVLPIAEHEYTYRYVLPAVPLACIAAAITLRKPAREPAQGPGQEAAQGLLPARGSGPGGEAPYLSLRRSGPAGCGS
jgi:hypothetical protein